MNFDFVLFCAVLAVLVLDIFLVLLAIAYRRLRKKYLDLLDKHLTLLSCYLFH